MNRIRFFAVGTLMVFAMAAGAQQAATAPAGAETHSSIQNSGDPVEHHLQVLSEKLNLRADQQDRVRPILKDMHDSMEKIEQNQNLSDEERMEQKHAAFMKADAQIRPILNDDQKKTLDQMEQDMHSRHGN